MKCSLKSKGKTKKIFEFKEDDKSCHLINPDNNEILLEICENEKNTKIKELGMTVSSVKNIEMDGIFILDKFILPKFNDKEVKLIYNDIKIDPNEQNKTYVIIEVKQNKKKLNELIQQLKHDYSIMSKIIDNKIILLGFVGTGDLDEEIDLNEELGHLNCAIFEIKEDKVLGKKIKQFIDWDSVKDIDKIKKDVETIKRDVETIKRDVEELKDKIEQITQFINNKDKGKNEKKQKCWEKRQKEKNKYIAPLCAFLLLLI